MNIRFIVVLSLVSFLTIAGLAQNKVEQMDISQSGDNVEVSFILEGKGIVSKIELFYSTNGGITWLGPVKKVSGNLTDLKSPGTYSLIWNAVEEAVKIEGSLRMQIIAYYELSSVIGTTVDKRKKPKTSNLVAIKRAKTWKGIWFFSAIISTGVGAYSTNHSNTLYVQYQDSNTDTSGIKNQIETMDIIAPIAYAFAGLCTVGWIVQWTKQGKLKRQLSFQVVPVYDGAGIKLAYRF